MLSFLHISSLDVNSFELALGPPLTHGGSELFFAFQGSAPRGPMSRFFLITVSSVKISG